MKKKVMAMGIIGLLLSLSACGKMQEGSTSPIATVQVIRGDILTAQQEETMQQAYDEALLEWYKVKELVYKNNWTHEPTTTQQLSAIQEQLNVVKEGIQDPSTLIGIDIEGLPNQVKELIPLLQMIGQRVGVRCVEEA